MRGYQGDPEDRERRWQLVLVHPESLVNDGFELPAEELTGDSSCRRH